MTPMERKALGYVRNTNGGATRAHFMEDHEPVGDRLWKRLHDDGLVREDQHGRIHLTVAGRALLAAVQ
jgi:ribosomal protein S19E (S16A)